MKSVREAFLLVISMVFLSLARQSPATNGPTGEAPYFISQPHSISNVVEGGSATLSVIAGGTAPLSFQWIKDAVPVPNATSPNLTLLNLNRERDGGTYQVMVSNGFGSITSIGAYLFIWPYAPAIIQQPESVTVEEGDIVRLFVWTVTADTPRTYQWYKDGVALQNSIYIQGANDAEITVRAVKVEDAGEYTVTISNSYGSVKSVPAIVSVAARPPQLWSGPFWYGVGVARGAPLVVNIEVRGAQPMQYQWFRTHTNAGQVVEMEISGATSATLTIPNVQFDDSGEYWVKVTNPGGSVTGRFPVVVEDPPIIVVEPPERISVLPAQLVPLNFRIVGSGLYVQWFRDGTLTSLSGSPLTNAFFEVTFFAPGWEGLGNYFAIISNAAGSITSKVYRVERQQPVAKRPPSSELPDAGRGLVAYWPFDETQGTSAKDLVGHYDLDVEGYFEVGRRRNALTSYGGGATFNSTSANDDVPINRNAAFTISFWIWTNPTNNFGKVAYIYREGKRDQVDKAFGIGSGYNRAASFQFSEEPTVVRTESVIIANQGWRHVVFVQEEDGHRWLYIDGIEADASLPVALPSDWKPDYIRLGADDRYHSAFKLDDVALWKRALSAEEIRVVKTSGIPGFGSEQEPLGATFQSIQKTGSFVTVNWKPEQAGMYSLEKSGKISGPWTIVTNLPTSSSETNAFTDVTADERSLFYRIGFNPQ